MQLSLVECSLTYGRWRVPQGVGTSECIFEEMEEVSHGALWKKSISDRGRSKNDDPECVWDQEPCAPNVLYSVARDEAEQVVRAQMWWDLVQGCGKDFRFSSEYNEKPLFMHGSNVK